MIASVQGVVMKGRPIRVVLILVIASVALMQFMLKRQNTEMSRTIEKAGSQLEDVFSKPAQQKQP